MKTVQYVIVFVVRPAAAGHEVLLGLRAEGRYMGGTWQLITGSIEPDETAWQAAIREVKEETGLTVEELYRLSPMTQFYRSDIDSVCIAPMFAATVAAGAEPTIDSEHTSLQWLPPDTAAARLMWATDKAALAQLRSDILNNGPAKPYLKIDVR